MKLGAHIAAEGTGRSCRCEVPVLKRVENLIIAIAMMGSEYGARIFYSIKTQNGNNRVYHKLGEYCSLLG